MRAEHPERRRGRVGDWKCTESSHNVECTGWSGNDAFGKGTLTRAFATAGAFALVDAQ